jgi:hypothetical protein
MSVLSPDKHNESQVNITADKKNDSGLYKTEKRGKKVGCSICKQ